MVMDMPMIVGAHTLDEVQLALDWASESVESYCERKFAYNESATRFRQPVPQRRGPGSGIVAESSGRECVDSVGADEHWRFPGVG